MKKLYCETYEAAESALQKMKAALSEYGRCSVADVYDIMGWSGATYIDDQCYWDGFTNAYIAPKNGAYELVLPELKEPNKKDMVNHPKHYISETGLEVIDVIEAFTFNLKGVEATDTGNIIKYACRWKEKNGVEDLKKLVWYAEHLIQHIENLEKENEE